MCKKLIIGIHSLILIFNFSIYSAEVTIEWNDIRQTIDGFGASDAWLADDIMMHRDKSEMLDALFCQERGAGLSI